MELDCVVEAEVSEVMSKSVPETEMVAPVTVSLPIAVKQFATVSQLALICTVVEIVPSTITISSCWSLSKLFGAKVPV
jgi:hypothetical protein